MGGWDWDGREGVYISIHLHRAMKQWKRARADGLRLRRSAERDSGAKVGAKAPDSQPVDKQSAGTEGPRQRQAVAVGVAVTVTVTAGARARVRVRERQRQRQGQG